MKMKLASAILFSVVLAAGAHAQGTWTTRAPMPTPRVTVGVAVVNGTIYAIGGIANSSGGAPNSVVEAYDTASDTWSSKASLPFPIERAAAGSINGIIYLVGGCADNACGALLNTVFAYDPATNTWTPKAPIPTPRRDFAVAVVNGILYAVGGEQGPGCTALASVEAYDPSTDSWNEKAPLPVGRNLLAAATLNGVIYAIGGSTCIPNLESAELDSYDPASNTWNTKAPMLTAANGVGAGVINGILYAVSADVPPTLNQAYNPVTSTWSLAVPMPTGRRGPGAAVVNGILYTIGGSGSGGFLGTNEAFTPAGAPNWTQLSPTGGPPAGRNEMAAAFDLNTDAMIIFGGAAGPNTSVTAPVVNDVWVLSKADGLGGTPSWTQLNPGGTPPSGRAAPSAVYDPSTNSLIVFGGNPGLGGGCGTVNDLWLLSHANGQGGTPQWTQLSPNGGPPPRRTFHGAVYDAASNRMIVFGGTDFCGNDFNDVWILENANNSGGTPVWVQLNPVGALPTRRDGFSPTYDPTTNRMTIFGGSGYIHPFGCPDPLGSTLCNDVWVLENANGLGGTPAWTQLSPTGGTPSPRNTYSAVYDPGANRMTIFDGESDLGVLNEVWVLSNANGLGGTAAWTQLSPTGGPPVRRWIHSAVSNPSSNRMTVFGGDTDFPSCCAALNDTWVLTNANGVSNQPPVAVIIGAPSGAVECASHSGTQVMLDGSGSHDPDGDTLTYQWREDGNPVGGNTPTLAVTVPLGTHTFALTVTDPGGLSSTAITQVTVQDTTPPNLSVSLSPNTLWPPNHKLVPITATINVSDTCDANPSVVLLSITANEPLAPSDIQGATFGTDDRSFELAATRLGSGSGRIYTVTYKATDHSGNSTTASAQVTVPHDQGH